MSPEHDPLPSLSSPRRNLYIPMLIFPQAAGPSAAPRGAVRKARWLVRNNAYMRLPPPFLHRAVDLAPGIARGDVCALIVQLFALAYAQLQLYFTTFEVKLQGDKRISLQFLLLL